MVNLVPLLQAHQRDVIVNVMYNFIHRFQDDARDKLREGLWALFGLRDDEIPTGLDEEGLMTLYRDQLEEKAKLRFAADLAVPHPRFERTWYRLVLGGRHQAAVQLFRDVEAKVMGREAPGLRATAQRRHREKATGQLELGIDQAMPSIGANQREHERDRKIASSDVVDRLSAGGPLRFKELWPGILEARHITRAELNELLVQMVRDQVVAVRRPRTRAAKTPRSISDTDVLELSAKR